VAKGRERGVAVIEVHREGRNYVELLKLARDAQVNLVVIGATGLGHVEGYMGSNARRVLADAPCDVLIAREEMDGGPIMVGVDGSEDAGTALRKAVQYARIFGGDLVLAAAYDPAFHTKIFRVMGRSLTAERQQEVGLSKQEDLHDQIIDDGLGKLYQTFLDDAGERCRAMGMDCRARLVQAKAFRGLLDVLGEEGASLSVVGRFGHNRTEISRLGSNSEALAALSRGNVLVTTMPGQTGPHYATAGTAAEQTASPAAASSPATGDAMRWQPDAEKALERVTSFARPMARGAVEKHVRESGRSEVTVEDFREVASRFGMGPGAGEGAGEGAGQGGGPHG
jgi:nucleotide-binding universal stress UspA family protein